MKKLFLGLVVFAMCSASLLAQDKSAHAVKPAAATKYMKLPMLPQCMDLSAQEGDPSAGSAVILIKMPAGCQVPWHWHTANERLYFVSGRGKLEMKDHGTEMVSPGDYTFLPAKGIHQFTCSSNCLFFDVPDGAFDIHYVKADGSEISLEEALKTGAKK